jgi:anthranilate synthase component I
MIKRDIVKQSPLVIEIEGDELTPIAILQKISGPKKFLLESSLKHQDAGRYSFIGADPILELISSGTSSRIITKNGGESTREGDPLQIIKEIMPEFPVMDQSLPLMGGAVGYIGYDIIRHFENIGESPSDEMKMPDVHLMFYEEVIIYDHLEQKVLITGTCIQTDTTQNQLKEKLQQRHQEILHSQPTAISEDCNLEEFQPAISKEEFIEKVDQAKEFILKGDIFQVVLSQRMKAAFTGDPLQFYRRLRIQNPSPYMYFIDFTDYVVAGSSPESLIKVTGRDVYANPIAGTKRRGKTLEEDEALAIELKEDMKELAEHRMLVDLGRNDLGRVSKFGTVAVTKYMEVEKFKHVMHLVSEARGVLKDEYSGLDALAACLPAGTVSGAPKIRAMTLINELEQMKRGVYAGAIGYISANGDIDFALAIRTMILKDGYAFIQAGAGIVHDSKPELEYQETINKLKGFLGDQL